MTLGRSSAVSATFEKRGGARETGDCEGAMPGESTSLPKTALSCWVADRGGCQPSPGLRGGSRGGNCECCALDAVSQVSVNRMQGFWLVCAQYQDARDKAWGDGLLANSKRGIHDG